MQQLLLDIRPAPRPTLGNFVAGVNLELILELEKWEKGDAPEKAIYLWGPPGSGKTHLLKALTRSKDALLWNTQDEIATDTRLIALDDIDFLDDAAQIRAFDAFNQARAIGRLWIAAGQNAPSGLKLREDLRTRLGWGLIFRLRPLSDDDKQAALIKHARNRGFELDPAIASWLLTHQGRDLGYLLQLIDALDRYSLETKRRISLPLLKTLLT